MRYGQKSIKISKFGNKSVKNISSFGNKTKSSHQNKKALSPFFGKLSYDHTDALHPIFYRIFGLNPSKTNLKWPNFKFFEK